MTTSQARALWLSILDEHFKGEWHGVDISEVRDKLKLLRFTYGGEIKKYRNGKNKKKMKLHFAYEYASCHFPSLLKLFNEMKDKDLEEIEIITEEPVIAKLEVIVTRPVNQLNLF